MQHNILIATILTAHGVRGWVKLHWHGEDPLLALTYKTLYDKNGRAFEVMEQRMQGKALAVKFKDIDDRGDVEKLRGTELFIARDRLPAAAENEFYHIDLIGLHVRSTDGKHIGTVRAIQNFGASDLLEVSTARGDVEYFPFTDDVVTEVNAEEQLIIVNMPEYDE